MRRISAVGAVCFLCMSASGCTVTINDPPAEIERQAKEQISQQTYAISVAAPGNTRIERPRPLVVATSPQIPQREDQPMKETAADALARIGTAAVPQVTVMLSDPNPELRKRAAHILAQIGPDAKIAVPELINRLRDEDEDVRKAAAHALGQMGPAAGDAVPALLRAAQDEPLVP
jgi:hypothetical protein